jgi:tetratricopeptide (TPR) repeat protein
MLRAIMLRGKVAQAAGCLIAILAFCGIAPSLSAPCYAAGSQPNDSAESPSPAALLDNGFRSLYELNFKDARTDFLSYQQRNPADAMGAAAEAASYLYEQFDAKGIFTSQFFLNDDKFLHGADGTAAENCNTPFLTANNRARAMAKRALKTEPNNAHALLVLTMADGMESDYDAMIVKKQMAGLGLMRQAEAEANKLLVIDPDAKDAYLALGASNYVIGNLPGFKRAFLWFGGIHGDKNRGIQQMQLAADQGHYLKPFAKIMLALAYEREHQIDLARPLLASLVDEFPRNPLYAHELLLIDHPTDP